MDLRYATSPQQLTAFDTEELRAQYLVEDLFVPGQVTATYTHHDITDVRIHDLPPSRSVLAWRSRNRHRGLRAFLNAADEVTSRS